MSITQQSQRAIKLANSSTQWSIALLRGQDLFSLQSPQEVEPLITAKSITDIPAKFVADPFLIRVGSAYYIFFEVMNKDLVLGEIACSVSHDLVSWTYLGIVLRDKTHFSYPHIFEHQGAIYMLPENKESGQVSLYQAQNFPYDWRPVARLIKGRFRDSSLIWHQDRWWMFSVMRGYSLAVHYAKDLFGPWRAHFPRSVYFYNKARARPAGRMLTYNDQMIRFSQDNRFGYGLGGVRAFSVERLTPWRFKERELSSEPFLKPTANSWCSHGMHHVDAMQLDDGSWIAAVDGCGVIAS